jgi:hypothetical protein
MAIRTSKQLLDAIRLSLFGLLACWMTYLNGILFIPFSMAYLLIAFRRRYYVVMGMLISLYVSFFLLIAFFITSSGRSRYSPNILLDPEVYGPFLICFVGAMIGLVFDRVNASPIETEPISPVSQLLPPSETAPHGTSDNVASHPTPASSSHSTDAY